MGKAVDVTLVDASRFVGVLDCIDPDDFSLVLKNTQRKSDGSEPFDSGSTVVFKRGQIAHVSADGLVNYTEGPAVAAASAGAAPGFRTDTEISGRSHEHLFGRELQSAASWLDPQLDSGELEDPHRRASGKVRVSAEDTTMLCMYGKEGDHGTSHSAAWRRTCRERGTSLK